LSASISRNGTHSRGMSHIATWWVACTPLSVRPAAAIPCGAPSAASAASTAPCTLGRLSCRCQPENGAPSYSIFNA